MPADRPETTAAVSIDAWAEDPKTTDAALLDWLDRHPQCELSYAGWDDEPRWQVHRVTGGRNDREWSEVGQGETVREAIRAAMDGVKRRAK